MAVYNGGTGKTSVASDCLLRGNGASALLESGVKIDGNDNIHGFRSAIVPVAGTSYTLAAADTGKIVETVNSGEVTLIIPDSLPQGFTVTVAQMGAGQVVFSATGGATLLNRHGHDRTAGQYALCTLYISSNSDGSSAISVMAGDAA